MSKMGEYAAERALEITKRRPRKKSAAPGNVPTAIRDQHVDRQIAECISNGLDEVTATASVVAWNANQPSPLKVSKLKQRVYLAYRAAEAGSE